MNELLELLIRIPGIIIATTLHEFVKAAVATVLGNYIPKSEGRLTLNPAKHFEPIGFIIMLYTGFGWGKPVNIDNSYIKDNKNHTLIAYTSAIFANLFIACLLSISYNMFNQNFSELITVMWQSAIYSNIALAVFNIIPIYPLAGSKIFSSFSRSEDYFRMLQSEKILQMILVFLLFMGVVGTMLNPIIAIIMSLFGVNIR